MRFNKVELTEESIQKTRKLFADNALECIKEVQSGEVKVNDLELYSKWCEERANDALEGKMDNTLTFMQRAHYVQTGECIALLP